jgi:sortase A
MAMPKDYWEALDIGGIMGYVEIPKISVMLPIYHGTKEENLKKGVGHLEGSTLPIGGASRHSVLTGHTGLTEARLFSDLNGLEIGDLFYIEVLGEKLAYKVDLIKIIEPNNTDDLQRFTENDYVTLLTCTPYGVNSHRLLVRGERVEYNEAEKEAILPSKISTTDQKVIQAALITLAAMAVLVPLAILFVRRRKKTDRQVDLFVGVKNIRALHIKLPADVVFRLPNLVGSKLPAVEFSSSDTGSVVVATTTTRTATVCAAIADPVTFVTIARTSHVRLLGNEG